MSQLPHETVKGKGLLLSYENPTKEYQVEYEFNIHTRIVERDGFSGVAADKTSSGGVRRLDGEPIAEGYYQLHAADGEIMRVKNLGFGGWVILNT
jgi:hypothetical protein